MHNRFYFWRSLVHSDEDIMSTHLWVFEINNTILFKIQMKHGQEETIEYKTYSDLRFLLTSFWLPVRLAFR